MKFPVHPKRFKQRQERFKELKILFIPTVLVHECESALKAYYGGAFRAAWFMVWKACYIAVHDYYWRSVVWISDHMGWTKLRPLGPGEPLAVRHSGKCDRYNCQDMDCYLKTVPNWYKKLTHLGQ